MSDTSPNLGLSLVMPAQAQKHVTVNESLLKLDALVQPIAQSRSVTVQPASPGEGQAWLIPDGASGADWALMAAHSIAVFRDGFWTEIIPREGWQLYLIDEAQSVTFSGSIWYLEIADRVIAETANGAQTRTILVEQTLSGLSGASVVSTEKIPARSIVFCVSVRTTEVITGAVSFDCGISGEVSKFGGSLGVSLGASNLGVIGPTAFYADTPIELTANGGNFTGGSVAIAIHALLPVAPVG